MSKPHRTPAFPSLASGAARREGIGPSRRIHRTLSPWLLGCVLSLAGCKKEGPEEHFRNDNPPGSMGGGSTRDDDRETDAASVAESGASPGNSDDGDDDRSDPDSGAGETSDDRGPSDDSTDDGTSRDEPDESSAGDEPPSEDAGRGSGDDETGFDASSPGAGPDPVELDASTADDGTSPDVTDPAVPMPPEDECGAAPASDAAFTRGALREAAAECATWHYCKFEAAARYLDERTQSYADDPGEETLEYAQHAFRLAMQVWSSAELFQFGPLGSKSESAGKDMYEGRGLRDLIYAWPSTSRCRVEEQLISQNYAERGMQSVLISGRGLFGLEYLLFYTGQDTACSSTSAASSEWAELSSSELRQRKLDYAAALGSDLVDQINTVIDAWAPDGEDFTSTFVNAGGAYPNEQEVMQVMAWSLIYVERELKDWKVGIPAGYTLTHPVSNPETPYAQIGAENIRANLGGFRRLFQGCGERGAGLGFDDWLIEVGHAGLAADLVRALDDAESAAAEFPGFEEASAAELETLYQAVRALTTLLKSEFFGAGSALNLELPGGVASDTD